MSIPKVYPMNIYCNNTQYSPELDLYFQFGGPTLNIVKCRSRKMLQRYNFLNAGYFNFQVADLCDNIQVMMNPPELFFLGSCRSNPHKVSLKTKRIETYF